MKSILDSLATNSPIDIAKGTWSAPGSSGLSVVWDKMVSIKTLATATTQLKFFTGEEDEHLTNVTTNLVPGGDRWDLFGLNWFFGNAAGVNTAAVRAAFRAMIQGASLVVTLGKTVITESPLIPYFGNVGNVDTYVSTVTAATAPATEQSWKDPWPKSCWLALQETVKFQFVVNFSVAPGADLNGALFGAWYDRARASRTAG